MKLRTSMTTRQGRKVPRHLYIQLGHEPDDGDPPIGIVDTPAIAALIVAAVNAYIGQDPQRARALAEYAGPAPGQEKAEG